MSIEEIKNRLERFGLGKRIAYDPNDPLTLWPMLDETVKDARFLLAENQRLVEALEAIGKFAGERKEINMYLETVFYACDNALQAYKLLEKKD